MSMSPVSGTSAAPSHGVPSKASDRTFAGHAIDRLLRVHDDRQRLLSEVRRERLEVPRREVFTERVGRNLARPRSDVGSRTA